MLMTALTFFLVVCWSLSSSMLIWFFFSGINLTEGKAVFGSFYNIGFAVFYFFHVFPGEYERFGLPVETVQEHPWIVWLSIPMILYHLWIIPGLTPSPIRLRRKWDPTFKRHGEP